MRGFIRGNILSRALLVVAICATCTGAALAAVAADEGHRTGLDHWAFKPVTHPAVPPVGDSSHVRNPVDAFVLTRLATENLQPSPEADRRTLIRRVSFDLTGLPPAPEEVEAFVADPDSAAYEKLVDRLLASARYGERWGRHWLDVVRFAESDGFEMNWARAGGYHYRDWVIRAFNDDKPYDEFVRDQLAGDALGADAATGFLVGGAWDRVKSPDPVLTAQQRADELHDMVSTAGSAFLGLTVGCARCHDHKFDPISQLDYYRMTAVFAGVQHGERALTTPETRKYAAELAALRKRLADVESRLAAYEPLADVTSTSVPKENRRPGARIARNVDRFAPVRAKSVRFKIYETSDVEPCIDELEIFSTGGSPRNVALASNGAKATASGTFPNADIHKLEHLNDGRYGNERSWISNEIGKGWVQIELPEPTEIDRVVWGRDRNLKYKDRLATKYTIEVAEATPGDWKLVARSDDRLPAQLDGEPEAIYRVPDGSTSQSPGELVALLAERKSIKAELQKPGARAAMGYCGTFQQPGVTHRLARGDPTQPKEPVTPGAIQLIGAPLDLPSEMPEQQRRVKLAEWITDPKNPLTARVMVNRLWHYHFGRGLVATPSDFGNMGAKPTHPDLLDWLASDFVAGGWHLKALHRLICLSATYRQSSDARPDAMRRDAGDALLWRFPPKRLEAEAIRDAVLAVSGKLDLTIGGPGFSVFKPNDNYVRVYEPRDQWTPAEFRRMVYATKIRSQQDATFGAFDCPDGAQITPKRPTSTTPLQALNLLNGSFMLQQTEFFAERLKSEAGHNAGLEANLGFKLAFGRAPTSEEREAAMKLIGEHGLASFCRAMLNANEFVYVR